MQEDVVLCKVYRKATSFKVLEQKSLMEEQGYAAASPTLSPPETGGDRLGYGVPLKDVGSTFFHVPTISYQESNHDKTQKISAMYAKHGFVQEALSEEVDLLGIGNLLQGGWDNWSGGACLPCTEIPTIVRKHFY